jgi:hypothetical protein
MDAAGDAEQCPQPTLHLTCPGRLVRDLADDLEKRGLAGAVDADQPQGSSRFDFEADVLEDPAKVAPDRFGK